MPTRTYSLLTDDRGSWLSTFPTNLYKCDIFARSVAYSDLYEKVPSSYNIELIKIIESVPDGESDFLIEGMHELLAQYYSVHLSQNVKRSHEQLL